MKPNTQQVESLMSTMKEIGDLSLKVIYSSDEPKENAKKINKKAYESWIKLSNFLEKQMVDPTI